MNDEKFLDRLDHFAGIALKSFIDADKKLVAFKDYAAAEDIEDRCELYSDSAYMVAAKMVVSREWAIRFIRCEANRKNKGCAA